MPCNNTEHHIWPSIRLFQWHIYSLLYMLVYLFRWWLLRIAMHLDKQPVEYIYLWSPWNYSWNIILICQTMCVSIGSITIYSFYNAKLFIKKLRQDTDFLWSLQHIHMYNFLQIVHTKYCCMYYNGLHNQIHGHYLSIL